MSENNEFIIHTDGGARGNPGPAAYAFVMTRPGLPDVEEKGCLGNATNNFAEYTALIRALSRAKELGGRRLRIHSDSELMVEQMNGRYKVKNEGLIPLFEQAKELWREFEKVTLVHIRRELNKRADKLYNEALDGTESKGAPSRPTAKPKKKTTIDDGRVREGAIECLEAAAGAWRAGQNLSAELIWEQLWSLLEEEGVLKKV